MFRKRVLLSMVAGVLCAGMVGCGAGSPASTPVPAPAVTNLAGNWLLAGSIPQGPPFNGTSPGLSVTFSVIGNQVVGSGDVTVFCSTSAGTGTGFGEGFVVSGSVESDGTFTAQRPSLPSGLSALPITISGSVPSAPQQGWAGHYTIDASSQGSLCNPLLTGSFTAASIASATGTYAGAGTLGLGTSATPIGLTVSLQQGSTLSVASGGLPQQSSALSGTVSITGVPCFHSGTIVAPPTTPVTLLGDVAGDQVQADFKMDDGSSLLLVGYISDAAASALRVQSVVIFNGSCESTLALPIHFTSLARQN